MTLACSFGIVGITHAGEQEAIAIIPNIVTHDGLKHIAGSKVFKAANEQAEYHPHVNAFFLGNDNTPAAFTDNGLKDLELILPSKNANYFTYGHERFYSPVVYLPAGTYREIAIGYYDPQSQSSNYYNRAVLETPLVIDDVFYTKYKSIELIYQFEFKPNASFGRKSELTIGDVVYELNTFAMLQHFYGERNDYLTALETTKGAVNAGPVNMRDLVGTVTYLADTTTHVRIMEIKLPATKNTVVEEILVRNGGFLYLVHLRDVNNHGITIPAGKTLTLQLECYYLPGHMTEYQITENDKGPGYNGERYMMRNRYVAFNRTSLKSAYALNVETGERINYLRKDLGISDDDGSSYPANELDRASNPIYNTIHIDDNYLKLDKSGVWKIYHVNYKNDAVWQVTMVGDESGKPVTFQAPSLGAYGVIGSEYGYRLNSRPSSATHVRVYDSFLDKYTDCEIKTDGSGAYFYPPADMRIHLIYGISVTAVRFYNSNTPAQFGVWSNIYKREENYQLGQNELSANNALTHVGMKTLPIINFVYNRTNMTLSGQVFNADKVRIKEVGGAEQVYEFPVTPYSQFSIDLSTTNMSLAKSYKFSAIGELGESDGPNHIGFKSVDVAKITDAVYNAVDATIIFTRPADYIKHVVLRRWGFEFYRLELTTGQNILRLSTALDESGQWELIALDENGTESEPFYVFGEKPEDIPVKPENTTPELNASITDVNNLKTGNIGFYPNFKSVNVNKWWEDATWYATIDNVPVTIEYLGVVSRWPSDTNNYVPMLAFKLLNGEKGLAFNLSPQSSNTPGVWQALGGLNVNNLTVKLWHDWKQFDGYTESDMYDAYNAIDRRVYGVGNGYHQVTEVESGYVRRAIELKLDFSRNAIGISGACPINFDASYAELGYSDGITPAHSSMLPYLQVVLGHVLSQTGAGQIFNSELNKYVVRINDKPTTITERIAAVGQYSDSMSTSVTWANEDGVAYQLDLNTWFWTRTDREDHLYDPEYQDVVDTIQLCYFGNYRSQWGGGTYTFQSGITDGSTAFNANIRMLSYQHYWQSIKGWIRPYRSNDSDMIITNDDLIYSQQTSIQIAMDFDTALIDPGNQLQITINGETATLIEPTVPQLVEGIGIRDEKTWQYLPAAELGNNFTRLYDQLPLDPAIFSSGIMVADSTYQRIGQYTSSDDTGRMDIPLLTPNNVAYEAYRNSLANADDYITHAEMISIARITGSDNIIFVIELLPVERRTKRICLPSLWGNHCFKEMMKILTNTPDELVIGYNSASELTVAQYAATLLNCGITDPTKLMTYGSAGVIVGHRELTLDGLSPIIKSNRYFRHISQGREYSYGDNNIARTALLLDDLTGLDVIDTLYPYYSIRLAYHGDLELTRYNCILPNDVETGKTISKLLFGEDRTYHAWDNNATGGFNYNFRDNVQSFLKGGVFSVPKARELGYTGKYIYLITMSAFLPEYHRTLINRDDYPATVLNVSKEDTPAYFEALFEGKPRWGNEVIIDYVEVDLSATDEELEAIPSRIHLIPLQYSQDSPYLNYGRIHVTTTGIAPVAKIPHDVSLVDIVTGKEVTYRHNNMNLVSVTDPKNLCRRIVSDNYELLEMTGVRGYWKIVRALDNRVITDNPSRMYYPKLNILVKTKKFNTFNIFSKSPVEPLTKTSGDNVGHFLSLYNSGYNIKMSDGASKYFTDPRQLKIIDAYNFYNDSNGLGDALYRVICALYNQTRGYISAYYPVSWNNELVNIEPAIDWEFRTNGFTAPYGVNKLVAKVTKQDGTVIANLYINPYGYYGYTATFDVLDTTPGYRQLNILLASLDYISRQGIRNTYICEEMNSTDYYYAGAFNIVDFSAPPALNSYDFTNSYNNEYSAETQDIFNSPSNYKPFPSWDLVSTLEDLEANFTVYIDREIATITRTELNDSYEGRNNAAVCYEFQGTNAVFKIYYTPDAGAYRSEYIATTTTEKHAELIIESNKTYVSIVGHAYYKPVFTYSDMYNTNATIDYFETHGSSNGNYLMNNIIYAISSGVFYKPTAYFYLKNPDYIDVSQMIANGWKTAFATSYDAALNQFNSGDGFAMAMSGEFELVDVISPRFTLPLAISVNDKYPNVVGTYALNGHILTYPNLNVFDWGYAYDCYGNDNQQLSIVAYYDTLYNESELPSVLPTPNAIIDYRNRTIHPLDMFFAFSYVELPTAVLIGTADANGPVMMMSMSADTSVVELTEADGSYLPVADATVNLDGVVGPYAKVDLSTAYVDRQLPPGTRVYSNEVINQYTGETANVVHVLIGNPDYKLDLAMSVAEQFYMEDNEDLYNWNAPVKWAPKTNVEQFNSRKLFRMFDSSNNEMQGYTYLSNGSGYVYAAHLFQLKVDQWGGSTDYYQRTDEWQLDDIRPEMISGIGIQGELVKSHKYFTIVYISPWSDMPEYEVAFRDRDSGEDLTLEAVQALKVADPSFPIYAKRETRMNDDVEEYRMIVIERVYNEAYVVAQDIYANRPYPILHAIIGKLTGGLDLNDMSAVPIADRTTIHDIGIPNPLTFLFVLGNEHLGDDVNGFMDWMKNTCTVHMFNDMFEVVVNRNVANFTSWTYAEVEHVFTLTMESPDLSVVYRYNNVVDQPEMDLMERINFTASAEVTLINTALTELPIEYITRHWTFKMPGNVYPDYSFVLGGLDENGHRRPLFHNMNSSAPFVLEEERSGLWQEYYITYYTTESTAFGPYVTDGWPSPVTIRTNAPARLGFGDDGEIPEPS